MTEEGTSNIEEGTVDDGRSKKYLALGRGQGVPLKRRPNYEGLSMAELANCTVARV